MLSWSERTGFCQKQALLLKNPDRSKAILSGNKVKKTSSSNIGEQVLDLQQEIRLSSVAEGNSVFTW